MNLLSQRLFGVTHDAKVMIAIELAGDAFDAREEVFLAKCLSSFEIALRRSEADGAFSKDTAMRGGHFAATGVVGHSPVVYRAEGSKRVG